MLDIQAKRALQNLKSIVSEQSFALNEQTTKHFLILPFLSALGYDINDPRVLMHEYKPADLQGNVDKVDYALNLDNFFVIIEAKTFGTNIKRYYHQLQKYYNSTPTVKLGIITDGQHYHFFTDFYYENLMDIEPFYTLDILNLSEYDYDFLSLLTYSKISINAIQEAAEDIIFKDKLLISFKKTIEELHPDFLRVVLKDFYPHPVTRKILDKAIYISKQVGLNKIDLSNVNTSIAYSQDKIENIKIPSRTEIKERRETLTKGQKVSLLQKDPTLNKLHVGLSWDASQRSGEQFDLDCQVFMLGENELVPTNNHFVFYNNLTSPDGSTRLLGDNLTGHGDGDDEVVLIDLSKVSSQVKKIVFVVSIYEGKIRRQNFGMVKNAAIQIKNQINNQEILRFELTDQFSNETCLIVGEIYRHNGEWKFSAVGSGYNLDIENLCRRYGLAIS